MTSLPRACISCGRAIPTQPHAPRCHRGRAQAPSPARRRYQEQHGYAHQQRRLRFLKASPTCAYAYMGGCRGALTLDYIQPLSLGGQATDENAQILCMRHNVAKGGRNRLARAK